MLAPTKVEALIDRAWRRRLLVLSVDQSALALAAVFGGLALLIILGTQILAWPWLLAIAAIGVGLSATGIRRRLVDRYSVAQILDRRLAFSDALSTAWFLRHSAEPDSSQTAARQISYAETLAETADPAVAFPFERQRAWTVTGLLCLLTVGLFSARYVVTRDLSLRQNFLPLSLTEAVENTFQPDPAKRRQERELAADAKTPGLPPSPLEQAVEHAKQEQRGGQNSDPNQPLQSKAASSDGKGGPSSDQNQDQSKQDQSKQSGGDTGDAKRANSGQGQKGSNAQDGKQTPNSNPQNGKQQESNGSQHSDNLMSRMRDALSSVMAKIKPSGKPDGQQGAQKDSDGKKNSEQSGSKDQNAGDSQKDSEKEQSATEQASGQQQGQGAAKAQTSGKDSAQASDKNGSDAQSGAGHSDGDKDIEAAEQAKVMGKLAEIIGKRSANLTGDMRVEPSGKQHLQTAYTNQQAKHADSGGEINRDEVGVEDQEYVREYMELVRKDSARKRAQEGTTSH